MPPTPSDLATPGGDALRRLAVLVVKSRVGLGAMSAGERDLALALAAFARPAADGPTVVEGVDLARRTLRARARADGRSVDIAYFGAERAGRTQSGCPLVARGDWVAEQLVDPASLRLPFTRTAYPALLAGDPLALTALNDRIVLVGTMLPAVDVLTLPGGQPRWGMELIAAQLDGLLLARTVRAPGPGLQAALGIALGLAGAALAIALHGRPGRWLLLALVSAALGWVLAVIGWYLAEGQLLGAHYGWVALALGAYAARRIMRSAL